MKFGSGGWQGPTAGCRSSRPPPHGAGGGTSRVGPTQGSPQLVRAGLWSIPFHELSCSPILPATYHKESIYFSSVAGLPPLTWTLFAAAERVWHVFGSLGLLQIIKHLQHLFFSKIEVAVAIGRIWSTVSATGEGAHPQGNHIPAWEPSPSDTSDSRAVYVAHAGLILFA